MKNLSCFECLEESISRFIMSVQNLNAIEKINEESENKPSNESFFDGRSSQGAHLKYLRKKNGFTLETLANIMDVSISYLSRLESGSRRLNPELVAKFAEAFNCDVNEFTADMDKPFTYPMAEAEAAKNKRASKRTSFVDPFRITYLKRDVPAYVLSNEGDGKLFLKRTAPHEWLFRPIEFLDKTVFAILCKDNFKPYFSEKGILYVNGDTNFSPENNVLVCRDNGQVVLKKVWAVTPNSLQLCDYNEIYNLKSGIADSSKLENISRDNLGEIYKIVGYSDFNI